MRCVIHIGTEKTGTSLLQEWLYANFKGLCKSGIWLTERFGTPNNRHFPAYFRVQPDDFALQYMLNSPEEKEAFLRSFRDDFEAEIAKAKSCHTILITSEHFHSRLTDTAEVAALRAFLDPYFDSIEIVCYFREQSDMALSSYSTHVKGGGDEDIDSVMANVAPYNPYYNFLSIADLWSGVFGKENCRFRIYDRARFISRDIRRDFLEAIGAQTAASELSFDIENKNPALSGVQAIVFRQINRAIPYFNEDGGINRQNVRLKATCLEYSALAAGTIFFPSQDEVAARFNESNHIFFETYLPNERGFTYNFREKIGQPEMTEAEISDIVASVSQCFLKEIKQLNAQERTVNAQERAGSSRVSMFARWRQVADYKIHKWLSETPLVSRKIRKRFRGPAERRRRQLRSKR
ncbi:hypothetical protein [uncultured Marivita sp.]|uniref:hypothetical protein n=1 Tax=uncultured Marivita sp. TaxID=888080 RepID=UPI00260C9E10|nr:hypothetical protein [uncultured Marivita sp.]